MNPIGQLWDQLGRVVRIRVTVATMQDLRQIVVDQMSGMLYHSRAVQWLIISMRQLRYEVVVAAFGGYMLEIASNVKKT